MIKTWNGDICSLCDRNSRTPPSIVRVNPHCRVAQNCLQQIIDVVARDGQEQAILKTIELRRSHTSRTVRLDLRSRIEQHIQYPSLVAAATSLDEYWFPQPVLESVQVIKFRFIVTTLI